MGRPSKFEPDLGERIVRMVRDGAFRRIAAEAEGVSRRTLARWVAEGREADPEGDLGRFVTVLLRAEAAAETEAVACVLRAARAGEWKAAAWYLERKHPDRFGRVNRVEFDAMAGRKGDGIDRRVRIAFDVVPLAVPSAADLAPAAPRPLS